MGSKEQREADWPIGTRVIAIRDTNGNMNDQRYAYKKGDVGTVTGYPSAWRDQLEVTFDGQNRTSVASVADTLAGGGAGVRKLTESERNPLELETPPELEAVYEAARWVELFSTVESARRLRKCVMHAAELVADGKHVIDDDSAYVDAVVIWEPRWRRHALREDNSLPLCASHAQAAVRAALSGRGMHPGRLIWIERSGS